MRKMILLACTALLYGATNASAAQLTIEKLFGQSLATLSPNPAPQQVTAPTGDPNRLFYIDRLKGEVSIYDRTTNSVSATPFVSLPGSEFDRTPGRQYGGFSLAFHPSYGAETNPVNKVYISFVDKNDDLRVVEYTVSAGNPNVADASSYRDILTVPYTPTSQATHYGGDLDFDKDGYLYVTTGDSTADSNVRDIKSQDMTSLQGKILKLDVSGDAYAGDPLNNFKPAPGNIQTTGAVTDAIWAIGARNPYQASVDPATGAYYIGDVGESKLDELNIGRPRANFGWPNLEGTLPADYPFAGTLNTDPTLLLTSPLYSYGHGTGPFEGFSIVGGLVYRGELAALQGLYFFSDFGFFQQGGDPALTKIWSLRPDPLTGTFTDLTLWTLNTIGGGPAGILSFGEDGDRNLYVTALNGVFKITGTDLVAPAPSPVPIPAAGLLLAAAVAGLGGVKRYRRR